VALAGGDLVAESGVGKDGFLCACLFIACAVSYVSASRVCCYCTYVRSVRFKKSLRIFDHSTRQVTCVRPCVSLGSMIMLSMECVRPVKVEWCVLYIR
jgi:hypothetical protein